MAEANASQSHNKPNFFNPFNLPAPFDFSAFAGMTDFWQKAAGEQQARVSAMVDEMAKMEEKNAAEARRAVEEMARLTLASLDYSRELSANFRKTMLEMSKRLGETQAAPAAQPAPAAKKN